MSNVFLGAQSENLIGFIRHDIVGNEREPLSPERKASLEESQRLLSSDIDKLEAKQNGIESQIDAFDQKKAERHFLKRAWDGFAGLFVKDDTRDLWVADTQALATQIKQLDSVLAASKIYVLSAEMIDGSRALGHQIGDLKNVFAQLQAELKRTDVASDFYPEAIQKLITFTASLTKEATEDMSHTKSLLERAAHLNIMTLNDENEALVSSLNQSVLIISNEVSQQNELVSTTTTYLDDVTFELLKHNPNFSEHNIKAIDAHLTLLLENQQVFAPLFEKFSALRELIETQYTKAQTTIDNYPHQKHDLERQLDSLENDKRRAESELSSAENQRSALSWQYNSQRSKISRLRSELRSLQSQQNSTQDPGRRASYDSRISSKRSELSSARNHYVFHQMSQVESEISSLESTIYRLRSDISSAESSLSQLIRGFQSATERKQELFKEIPDACHSLKQISDIYFKETMPLNQSWSLENKPDFMNAQSFVKTYADELSESVSDLSKLNISLGLLKNAVRAQQEDVIQQPIDRLEQNIKQAIAATINELSA